MVMSRLTTMTMMMMMTTMADGRWLMAQPADEQRAFGQLGGQ